MSVTRHWIKEDIRSIGFGVGWTKDISADGDTITYTAGVDGADAEVHFKDHAVQPHTDVKVGSKLIYNQVTKTLQVEEVRDA